MSSDNESGERPRFSKSDNSYLRCVRCKNRTYTETLRNKKEYIQLLSIMKNSDIQTPSRTQTKLKAIFHEESIFEFICPNCKTRGNSIDIINKLKEEIEISTQSNQAYANEISMIRDKNTHLEREMEILKKNLNDTQNELSNLNNYEQMEIDNTDETETEEESIVINKLNKLINKTFNKLNKNLVIMNSDIEARIKIEFEKIQTSLLEQSKIGNNGSDKKIKKVTFLDENNSNTQKTKDNNDKGKVKKLKPPNINTEDEKRDIYEIHLSKFHINTTEKDIETHIMENTKIKNIDTFKITKILSRNEDKNKSYIAFKITTLNQQIYEQIINEKIWKPEFEAKGLFKNNQNKWDWSQKILKRKTKIYKLTEETKYMGK